MGVAEILGVKMERLYVAVICLLLAACQPTPSNPGFSPSPGASAEPSPSLPSASGASSIPVGSPSPLASDVPLPAPSMTPQPELVLPASALTVLAGADEPGFQDGNGDLARFNHPLALAVDNQGYVYIADSSNHAIRKISPQGQVTTLAGSGQKGDIDALGKQASFTLPLTLTVDESGQVFILEDIYPREATADTHEVRSDQKNFARRLRKINREQVVSTLHINSIEILKDALQDIFWHEETKQL